MANEKHPYTNKVTCPSNLSCPLPLKTSIHSTIYGIKSTKQLLSVVLFTFFVVGDKILHCVLREELLELPVQLGRQGFIVRYYQSGFVELLDDICHREGLAGACNP